MIKMRHSKLIIFLLTILLGLTICACGGDSEPSAPTNPHQEVPKPSDTDSDSNQGTGSSTGSGSNSESGDGTGGSTGSDSNSGSEGGNENGTGSDSSSESGDGNESDGETDNETGSNSGSSSGRDSTSVVLSPSADGSEIHSCDVAVIDTSNSSEGYIMVNYSGSNKKVKLQITGPDDVTYTYNLHGGYETFPLTAGNGSYAIGVYENIRDTTYSNALSTSFKATISNSFGPYLYPSQYVDFTASTNAVAKGAELASTADTDLEVVENVYNYIIGHVTYDYDKAKTVPSGYLPDVDETLRTNKGICFDYASLMATMLRTQRIPTRLEIGYKGEEYHAWISVYIDQVGWINGLIEFDGNTWNLMDPTFASTSKNPKNFTSKNNEYNTKYVY